MKGRYGRGASPAAWVAVVLVVALAGAAAVYLVETGGAVSSSSGSITSSSTSAAASTSTASSVSSTASSSAGSRGGGLVLSLTLNATQVSIGHGLQATVDDVNTGAAPLNLSASKDWPVAGLAVGPCGTLNLPVGVAVLRGYYDLSNITAGTPLQLYSGVVECPMILAGITGYVFQPSSDNATVYGSCQSAGQPCMTERAESSVSFNGYWSSGAFVEFPVGVYTVVAGDEWGGIAVSHFVVTAGGA